MPVKESFCKAWNILEERNLCFQHEWYLGKNSNWAGKVGIAGNPWPQWKVMCVYVHMCIYMCVCTYVFICVCIYMCMCVYTCICVCTYVFIYVHIYTCVYMCVCVLWDENGNEKKHQQINMACACLSVIGWWSIVYFTLFILCLTHCRD